MSGFIGNIVLTGLVLYLLIGTGLAWIMSAAGGEKFKLNKASLPFIFKWPVLFIKK